MGDLSDEATCALIESLKTQVDGYKRRIEDLTHENAIAQMQMASLMKELTAPRPITPNDRQQTAINIVHYIVKKLRDADDENHDAVWDGCVNWLSYRLDKIAEGQNA